MKVVCQVWQAAFLNWHKARPKDYHAKITPNLIKEKRQLLYYQQLALFAKGGRWDSNPRHSEPQSDALTN